MARSGLVVLAGPDAPAAAPGFKDAGYEIRVGGPLEPEDANVAVVLERDVPGTLIDADTRGVKYLLVHVGGEQREGGGSYERAHHRISPTEAGDLAHRVRLRERPLVTCLAFAYKHGLPQDATWLVDVRFLDNPYWVPELRELTGKHREVADYVLRQPAAAELMVRLESALRWAIPLYQRDHLVIAFGCTGGRHRSVVLAAEMARRLAEIDSIDVEFASRDLE
jgi:hypothetical protein